MRHNLSYRGRLDSSNAEVAPLGDFIDEVMLILKSQPDAKEWSGSEPRHGRWAGITTWAEYLAVVFHIQSIRLFVFTLRCLIL
jgi:hypothetical protein